MAANVFLLRRLVGPIQALTALARRVDLTTTGRRMPAAEPTSEVGELALTFNEMLLRLEAERREATGRVLAAQEAGRLRIAQELYDTGCRCSSSTPAPPGSAALTRTPTGCCASTYPKSRPSPTQPERARPDRGQTQQPTQTNARLDDPAGKMTQLLR